MAVEVAASSHVAGALVLNLLGVAAATAPLALRRSRPLAAAGGSLAAALVTTALLTPLNQLVTPLALRLLLPYSVAANLPPRPALAGLALCTVGGAVMPALSPGDPGAILPVAGLTIAAWAAAGRSPRSRPDLAVAGEAVVGVEAVELARELEPDVVLMDIRMRGWTGWRPRAACSPTPAAARSASWSSRPSTAMGTSTTPSARPHAGGRGRLRDRRGQAGELTRFPTTSPAPHRRTGRHRTAVRPASSGAAP